MYNTCLRIVKEPMTAEDIMQDSFLAAFQRLRNFRNEMPFSHWLRKIVINRSLDYLRKKKLNTVSLNDMEFSDSSIDTDMEITLTSDREEILRLIKKEVEELPDGYRVIFSLFYLEGYDHEEISKILKITPSTSRSQLTRAKQLLIKKIKMKLHGK